MGHRSARRQLRKTLEWQDMSCRYCGVPMNKASATLEHLIPRSRGGSFRDNIDVTCFGCNQEKGDMTEEEFIASKGAGFVPRPILTERIRLEHERLSAMNPIGIAVVRTRDGEIRLPLIETTDAYHVVRKGGWHQRYRREGGLLREAKDDNGWRLLRLEGLPV